MLHDVLIVLKLKKFSFRVDEWMRTLLNIEWAKPAEFTVYAECRLLK